MARTVKELVLLSQAYYMTQECFCAGVSNVMQMLTYDGDMYLRSICNALYPYRCTSNSSCWKHMRVDERLD